MGEREHELLAMLRLTLCKGLGQCSINRLVACLGSAAAVLNAPGAALAAELELPPNALSAIERVPGEETAIREWERAESAGVRLLMHSDPEYPRPLRYLDEAAPPLLWMRGRWERSDALSVAVVGSRSCSPYGRTHARRLAAALASMGFTIVSGLARGIDSEAHRAALQAGGRSVAVVASGLDAVGKSDSAELAAAVAESGAILSELPMDVPPRAGNFPPRNRLISGLAPGVLVVEAAARSGSLITARLAAEQGKSVMALPGPVDSLTSRGAHELIRDGAILVQDAQDVVEALGPLPMPVELPAAEGADAGACLVDDPRVMALNPREREIHGLLSSRPVQIDEIITQTGLAASIVSSILLTLEIRGLARQLPGQCYTRP